MLLTGLIELIDGGLSSPEAVQSFMMAYSIGLVGLLCLPSVWTSLQRLLKGNNPAPQSSPSLWGRLFPTAGRWDAFLVVTLLMAVALPVSLALGYLAAQNENLAWLVLPPLNLLATGLPVLWLALLGMRKLKGGSAQQRWGLLASGVALGPILILVVEGVLLVAAAVIILIYLSSQPDKLAEIQSLILRIRSLPTPDQEELLRILEPYLASPAVIFMLVLMASVFVPMIEELLKPVGVWLLAWKPLSPAQGWVGGVISGAGFALFENLGNTSGAGDQWALVVTSRITAALLHMLTSGMVGWALVTAWSRRGELRGYLRLAAVYAVAVTIHGLWNGMAILGSAAIPFDLPFPLPEELPANGLAALVGLIVLCLINFTLYILINRALRPKTQAPASEIIPV
jgi:hypothetical protein